MTPTLNLPNKITVARLGLSILFIALLSQYSQRSAQPWLLDAATAIFILAAGTDFLDGYIARKRGLETPLGRILDRVGRRDAARVRVLHEHRGRR